MAHNRMRMFSWIAGTLGIAGLLGWSTVAAEQADGLRGLATRQAAECAAPAAIDGGWLSWRGPHQTGVSDEANLPGKVALDDETHLWTIDLQGRGTPVAVGDRLYVWGYRGEGANLVEVVACLEAATGKTIWEHEYSDFISDVIYDRYSIGAPTIDAESGNVYVMTTPGDLLCLNRDGKRLWHHAMGEQFGRMTFPNGRTGSPAIDGDLVIVNTISTNWGAEGPPRNRFYAFDKATGEPRWSSTPGVGPPYLKDSSFSTPVFDWDAAGRRVFYAGIGSGAIVCVNARTGQPIWRYQVAVGGINCTPIVHGDKVIGIHGVQNVDSTKVGRMFALDRTAKPGAVEKIGGAPPLPLGAQAWANDVEAFSSSPILVGEGAAARVYQVSRSGDLYCVVADTGKVLWKKKLGADQIHASPGYGDGKLYVPMNDGKLWVLRPSDAGAEEVAKVELDGNCLGAPCLWNGRVFVFTNRHLYAFGSKDGNPSGTPKLPVDPRKAKVGPVASLRVLPSEVLLRPGGKQELSLTAIDANGFAIGPVRKADVAKFIPPTAKVKAEADVTIEGHTLVAGADAQESAGAFKATAKELPARPVSDDATIAGTTRGRVLAKLPFDADFEGYDLDEKAGDGEPFAYPPLAWIGARFKWEVRERDGSKVLAKTLDRLILSRAITYLGSPDEHNYTMTADVMTDGNRRLSGEVGLINQRYMIALKGNHDKIEVTSNYERLNVTADFEIKPKTWYTLRTRVDVASDGSGVVRAKAWPRGSDEPDAWTIEVPVTHAHTEGSPGLYGFSPQNLPRVFIDNIHIEPNK